MVGVGFRLASFKVGKEKSVESKDQSYQPYQISESYSSRGRKTILPFLWNNNKYILRSDYTKSWFMDNGKKTGQV